jgi:Cu-Zn family superoxide dismutase
MNRLELIVLCLFSGSALVACDRPADPIQPVAPAASTSPSAPSGSVTSPVAPMPSASTPTAESRILVSMAPASGSQVSGQVAVSRSAGGILFQGRLANLAPGSEHGFHVHEIGDCSAPDASSAGDHFNPSSSVHGNPLDGRHHAGDLPNLIADGKGELLIDVVSRDLELGSGSVADIAGRALVLHAQPDDYTTQPAGASGERIACGVIGTAPAASPERTP